jgi:hypothetical protein|tara:strand:- start:95 stop:268 length:174 start_codon:yes stop_codon:yes gene_type:complete
MAKSLDKVLQADGSYKWELVDSWDPASEKKAEEKMPECPMPDPKKTTKKAKPSKVSE